jgi:hypothetical protein
MMGERVRVSWFTSGIVHHWKSTSRRWLRISRIACFGALFLAAADTRARDLEDFLIDLYGGDGLSLVSNPIRPSDNEDFADESLQALDALGSVLASNLSVFSLNSAVPGYTFDLALGVPVRTTQSLGPLIAERAETLGARKLNLAFSYTRLDFKRFEGKRLSNLSVTAPSNDLNEDGCLGCAGLFFELDTIRIDLDIDIEQDIFALFARYGVTENWDVGVVVPILRNEVRSNAEATLIRNDFDPDQSSLIHNFVEDLPCHPGCVDSRGDLLQSDSRRSSIHRSASGFGDILLRTKYSLLRGEERWPDLALRGQVKFATGKDSDFLGTGNWDFQMLIIASRQFGWFAPHLNVSYEISTGPSELDNVRYVVGFDARVHRRLTLAFDTIGRWAPTAEIGDHIVDFAIGGKWNVYRSLLLDVNFLVPLNRNEGLRPDFIWSLGFEYLF